MKLNLFLGVFYFIFHSFGISSLFAASDRLKDFRGTEQKLALLGFKTETVEPDIEKKFLEDARRELNKYSRSYGTASISGFNAGDGEKGKMFAPVSETMSEEQKKFLSKVAKDNAIDIVVLGGLSQNGLQLEMELQLYDVRIDTLSKVQKESMTVAGEKAPLENLIYKTMNFLDREGFVHESVQDFLQPPVSQSNQVSVSPSFKSGENEFAVNPADLAGGGLVGRVSIGGDKRPFWETWWFWTVIGSSLITAGGLSYFFLVANQEPSGAKIQFQLP